MITTSKQPRKQRKARYNAPLHQKQKYMGARLSSELSVKYNTRSAPVITGDTVTVMRGDYKGISGKVEKVDLHAGTIHVYGVVSTKVNGEEVPRPLYPSVVMITKLELKDKMREDRIRGKGV
jgi:large subunit ribosomal protein L24